MGAAAPRVTKRAPKNKKKERKKEKRKTKEKKGGTKRREDRTVNLYNERGTIQRRI